MRFPIAYSEVSVHNIFLCILSLPAFLRSLALSLLHTNSSTATSPESDSDQPTLSATQFLPVISYCDLAEDAKSIECSVCLNEFSEEDDIRCMMNCKHIFHQTCVDSWIDHDQKTCPQCEYDDDVALFSQHDDDHIIASI